jgi:hypothetical protein
MVYYFVLQSLLPSVDALLMLVLGLVLGLVFGPSVPLVLEFELGSPLLLPLLHRTQQLQQGMELFL